MEELKVGDVVELNSGSTRMKVKAIVTREDQDGKKVRVEVEYLTTAEFSAACVTKVA